MKKFLISSILTFAFSLGVTCFGQELSITTLPTGQKVIIKEVKDNKIVKIDTWINTGSINENENEAGISHFLEHLFFKGTQKYPTGMMDKILDSKGAQTNAATSKDYTHYYIQIPSEHFDLALELHSNMLLDPLIPRKELERERPVVIEEISKCKDSVTNRLFDNLFKAVYSNSNHPYQRNVIGKKEVIENLTREEILSYYKKFYTPDAFTTVIVGDIDTQDTLKKVESAFKTSNKNKQTKIKYPKIKPINKIERIEETMDINKTYLIMGFLAPKFEIENDNYALDVLSTILSSGKSSILNQQLKEKKELVLSIDTGNYSQKDSGLFYIMATLNPNKEELVEKEILNEIIKIQNGNLDNTIIEKAKNLIKTNTYYSRESISNISDDLGYDFTFSTNQKYYENYLKNIDKVSKKDIINVAKKYLITDKYAISIVRPENFKKISNVQNSTTQGDIKLVEQKEDTKFFILPNKASLITKNRASNKIIALNISIKGSKAIEKIPCSSSLTALSLTTGTKNYTNAELAQYLDENGIKLKATSSSDVFSILLQTTKDNLENALYILDEVINKPAFNEYEIEKIKQRKIQELKAISDSPSNYVFDEFKKQAYLNSIYGQNSTFVLNHIQKVKKDDIKEFYSRIINPENMTISVVGDIDENYIAQKLNSIIKENKTSEKFSFKNYKIETFKPTKNYENTIYKKEVQSNWLALGFKTCDVFNRKDIATLNVINAILGEGMSSRLFTKLREEQGLAYAVGSTVSTNILDSVFIAYIATNEQNIEKAKQGILEEFEILKKEMVTTEELNNAKDKILGNFLSALETNMDKASLLAWYNILELNLNAFEDYQNLIKNVSQSDIIETANKYFSNPYIYTVIKQKN